MFHQIIVITDASGTRKRVKGLATQQSDVDMPWNVQMSGKGEARDLDGVGKGIILY